MPLLPSQFSLSLCSCPAAGKRGRVSPIRETRQVSDLVENFNEARQDPKRSMKLFAKGAMPAKAEFKKYGGTPTGRTGSPEPGDTATAEPFPRREDQ